MGRKNYHPFVSREVFQVAAGDAKAISSFSTMFGSRFKDGYVYLQDVAVWLPQYDLYNQPNVYTNLRMRYGYKGRGFLIEEPVLFSVLCNGQKPVMPVWEFIKPYTIYPGQKMSARIGPYGFGTYSGYDATQYPAIAFRGVRLADNKPIILYDVAAKHIHKASEPVAMYRSSLQCPSDSPVNIYSVAFSSMLHAMDSVTYSGAFACTALLEVFDPDNRPWLQVRADNASQAVLGESGLKSEWIVPRANVIELGPDRGWILPVSQPFILEYENVDPRATWIVGTTIRGFVEVES